MLKNLKQLQESKIKYEVGMLYEYLKSIESDIQQFMSAQYFITTYNLTSNSKYSNRARCPFHIGAKNPTSFCFDDSEKKYHCQSCKESGSYLYLFHKLENTYSNYNQSKLLALKKFTSIHLPFDTLDEYKNLIRAEVSKRYEQIGSLNLKDYYDISILPEFTSQSASTYSKNIGKNTDIETCNKLNTVKAKDNMATATKYKLQNLDIDEVVRTADAEEVKRNGMTSYSKAVITAFQSNLIKDFSNNDLNSPHQLKEFMKRKYNINTNIAEKYGLIYFDKSIKIKQVRFLYAK